MTFTFAGLQHLADFLEGRAKALRATIPNVAARTQAAMKAEAHAYEQSAMIVRNTVIDPTVEAA